METVLTNHSFTLSPAERHDIPRLAEIHVVACVSDPCIRLKFPVWSEFQPRVSEMLLSQIGEANWTHVKAVDSETNQIAGWASWVTLEEETQEIAKPKSTQPDRNPPPPEAEDVEEGGRFNEQFRFLPGLGSYVREQTDQFLGKFAAGKRFIRCKALFVDPSFQRRGIGNALMRYGNQLADDVGDPIMLWATPSGHPTYLSCGFHVVGELNIDLRQWAGGQGENPVPSDYTIRYMCRPGQANLPSK